MNCLTIVEEIYHSAKDSQPWQFGHRFQRSLKTDNYPTLRSILVSSQWSALNRLELPSCGMISLINEEGRRLPLIPSPTQQQLIAGKILEIGHREFTDEKGEPLPMWTVPPGESFRGNPVDLSSLVIRCRNGAAEATLAVFPE